MPIPTSLKIIALLPPLRVQGVSFSGKIKSFPSKVSPASTNAARNLARVSGLVRMVLNRTTRLASKL
jgi:hypothetical protein